MSRRPISSKSSISAAHQRGISLIELMVGLVVALVLSLVMFDTLLYAEGQRRTTAAGNDAQQAGTLGTYLLERYLRMGGAGLDQIGLATQGVSLFRGCSMKAVTGTTATMPMPNNLSSPFAGLSNLLSNSLPGAPVLIANGGIDNDTNAGDPTPDVLIMMAGTHPSVNTWFQLNSGTSSTAQVINTLGLARRDYLVAVETDSTAANYKTCTVVQTSPTEGFDNTVGSPTYRQTTSANGLQIDLGGDTPSTGLTGYTGWTQLADIGSSPLFMMFGVGASGSSSQLSSWDMLNDGMDASGTPVYKTLIDGVVNLQAIYGLSDTSGTTTVTSWVAPVGAFSFATLRNGTDASSEKIRRIRAIRVAMIARSALQEKKAVDASTSITMFNDPDPFPPGLAITQTNTGDALKYRYRLFDFTIALRNQ